MPGPRGPQGPCEPVSSLPADPSLCLCPAGDLGRVTTPLQVTLGRSLALSEPRPLASELTPAPCHLPSRCRPRPAGVPPPMPSRFVWPDLWSRCCPVLVSVVLSVGGPGVSLGEGRAPQPEPDPCPGAVRQGATDQGLNRAESFLRGLEAVSRGGRHRGAGVGGRPLPRALSLARGRPLLPASPCGPPSVRVCVLTSYHDTCHTGSGSTLKTPFELNYVFKGPIFKYSQSPSGVLGVRTST